MILLSQCQMTQSKVDPEMCYRHDGRTLTCVMTIHVDDLKIAGEPQVVDSILAELGRQFGELTVQRGCFTNCGTRHVQDALTMEISLDQIEYAGALRTIEHPQMKTGRNEESCTPELHQLYMSLLGAVAYLSHTRVDLTVFIVALQRRNHNPEVQHVRKLNKLLRWLQRRPKKLTYKRMPNVQWGGSHLRVISDAAFKKETDSGHCLRGALFVRAPGNKQTYFAPEGKETVVHIIDYLSKAQRHVTRSTFAAELLSAGDAIDHGLLLSQMLLEIPRGPKSAAEAREQRSRGQFEVPLVLYIDAMSVFAAVTATFIKTPAEKSLLCHVQFLREMLDDGVIAAIVWLDTRDMTGDGMTKGAVSRDALLHLMDGYVKQVHAAKIWAPKVLRRPIQ